MIRQNLGQAMQGLAVVPLLAGYDTAAAPGARSRIFSFDVVGGLPGLVSWHEDGSPLSVMAFTVTDGRIIAIAIVTDPARLAAMDLPGPG
jgi:hypothetical protein